MAKWIIYINNQQLSIFNSQFSILAKPCALASSCWRFSATTNLMLNAQALINFIQMPQMLLRIEIPFDFRL